MGLRLCDSKPERGRQRNVEKDGRRQKRLKGEGGGAFRLSLSQEASPPQDVKETNSRVQQLLPRR